MTRPLCVKARGCNRTNRDECADLCWLGFASGHYGTARTDAGAEGVEFDACGLPVERLP